MQIIGAGLAGLVAGHFFRNSQPQIIERSKAQPDNHGAILRFRSRVIEDITGVPLKKVIVRKAIIREDGSLTDRCSLRYSNMYALKVSRKVQPRSIDNLEPAVRFIPPPDIVAKLSKGLNIHYGAEFQACEQQLLPIISTAPMKMWTNTLNIYPDYNSTPITVIETEIDDVDVHQTYYIPNRDGGILELPYRVSLVGSRMIIEIMGEVTLLKENLNTLYNGLCQQIFGSSLRHGEFKVRTQRFGKIVSLPDVERREILSLITEKFHVYSLGRFATWRNILLDDVVQDCKVIENLIQSGSGRYSRQLHWGKVHG